MCRTRVISGRDIVELFYVLFFDDVVTWMFFNILLPTLLQISKVNFSLMTAVLSTQRFSLSEQKLSQTE